jgi:hypothetical protein
MLSFLKNRQKPGDFSDHLVCVVCYCVRLGIYVDECDNDYGAEMLAAHPERLPTTIETLCAIAQVAKLDDLLVDPWNTPYQISTKVESNDEDVRPISARPDKQFGTRDHYSVELTRRNYFEMPGTSDGLNAFTHAGGLDLDTTLDQQGSHIFI